MVLQKNDTFLMGPVSQRSAFFRVDRRIGCGCVRIGILEQTQTEELHKQAADRLVYGFRIHKSAADGFQERRRIIFSGYHIRSGFQNSGCPSGFRVFLCAPGHTGQNAGVGN